MPLSVQLFHNCTDLIYVITLLDDVQCVPKQSIRPGLFTLVRRRSSHEFENLSGCLQQIACTRHLTIHSSHKLHQIKDPRRVSVLVVVPRQQFDKVRIENNAAPASKFGLKIIPAPASRINERASPSKSVDTRSSSVYRSIPCISVYRSIPCISLFAKDCACSQMTTAIIHSPPYGDRRIVTVRKWILGLSP